MSLNKYTTLSQATTALNERGFSRQFDFREGTLMDLKSKQTFTPRHLSIVEYHRFEGMSNPGDMSIVFAIKTRDGTRGTLISSYGANTDLGLFDFMDKIPIVAEAR